MVHSADAVDNGQWGPVNTRASVQTRRVSKGEAEVHGLSWPHVVLCGKAAARPHYQLLVVTPPLLRALMTSVTCEVLAWELCILPHQGAPHLGDPGHCSPWAPKLSQGTAFPKDMSQAVLRRKDDRQMTGR